MNPVERCELTFVKSSITKPHLLVQALVYQFKHWVITGSQPHEC